MKTLLTIFGLVIALAMAAPAQAQCTYNGKKLYVGEQGGCYYLNSSGEKEYVERKLCRDCDKPAKKKAQPKREEEPKKQKTDNSRRENNGSRREPPKNRRSNGSR
jgi:hypothetical protein